MKQQIQQVFSQDPRTAMPTLPATASAIIASALALLVRLMSDSTATSSPQGVHQTWSLTINFHWWKMLEAAKYQDAEKV